MKKFFSPLQIAVLSVLAIVGALFVLFDSQAGLALATVGGASLEAILKSCDSIEAKLKSVSEKADGELATLGKVTADTKTAMETLGTEQRVLADRIQQLEQKGTSLDGGAKPVETWGSQIVKAKGYGDFVGGHTNKMRVEVKNTLTGSDTNVAPARAPGIVSGAFQPLTLESLLPSTPCSSNAVEFTRENVFTNSAAEAAEGAAKAESALTWTLVNMPISTVAHWIKISRQLAADNTALAAYVDTRMRYGVNAKVEAQLGAGDGVAPNISGILDAGNFTAHGYANAALGATLKKLVLIRKIMADLWAAGYPADGILLIPDDWATIETELLTTAAGQTLLSYSEGGVARLWGVPVVQSTGCTADIVAVGAFGQAFMVHNREGVVVEMSDSDSDNFTKNLITIRAERRLALATERPAAVRAGDLTPA